MSNRPSRWTTVPTLIFGLLVVAMSASADISPEPPTPKPPKPAPPRPANDKSVELPLTVKLHDDSKPMKLELPEKVLAVKADAGDEADAAASAGANRTVIAAVFLSFAAIAGGLWFARKGGKGAATAMVVLVIGAAGVWVSNAWANRPPPFNPEPPRPLPPPEKPGLTIRIEASAKGKEAVLHVSEKQLKALMKQLNSGEKKGAGSPIDGAEAPESAPPATSAPKPGR